MTAWLWLVFWGSAFFIDRSRSGRFDVIYTWVGRRKRGAWFALVSAVALLQVSRRHFPQRSITSHFTRSSGAHDSASASISCSVFMRFFAASVIIGSGYEHLAFARGGRSGGTHADHSEVPGFRPHEPRISRFASSCCSALAGIGAPIAHAMIVAAVVYLAVAGQDLGLAAEQMIQGIYDSFIILAVPLFIVAANIMNEGAISDRLLDFCKAAVGRFQGRARPG